MDKCEVKLLLEKIIQEDGYGNPLYLSTDEMGNKYQEALKMAIQYLDDQKSQGAGSLPLCQT